MRPIKSLFQSGEPVFSFEVFPAKTPQGYEKLLHTLKLLSELGPGYISCTYGAGGGSRDKTFDIVEYVHKELQVPAMAHLTCVAHTRDEIKDIFDDFEQRGIENILALRGDPPMGQTEPIEGPKHFRYSADLVAFIRERFGDKVSIGVAGFPDKHLMAPSFEADAEYLKSKTDAGADFVITQLFFDNRRYFEYVERLRSIGVTAPIIPGVLPITNYGGLVNFCEKCGAHITDEVHELFGPVAEDLDRTLELGISFAVKQCRELLEGGAPGIHFYALNRISPVDCILKEIRAALPK